MSTKELKVMEYIKNLMKNKVYKKTAGTCIIDCRLSKAIYKIIVPGFANINACNVIM